MIHRARLPVLIAAVASTLGLALTVGFARDGGVVTTALILAVSWGVAISILDAAIAGRERDIPPVGPSAELAGHGLVRDQRR